jgi:hypothetical protein
MLIAPKSFKNYIVNRSKKVFEISPKGVPAIGI